MPETDQTIRPESGFLDAVQKRSGEKVVACSQCRKCTNGCPLAFAMDLMPNQVMRAVQLGLEDEVLRSETIWVCASCQTCTTRCPNDIHIAHMMDALRQLSIESGVEVSEPKIVKFHDAFLDSVRRHGRVYELGMIGRYKFRARDPFGGAKVGAQMFRKGKMKLLPSNIKGRDQVRRMFDKRRKG